VSTELGRRAAPRPQPRPGGRLRRHVAGRTTSEFLLLAGTTLALLVLGLVMTFSASFVQSAAQSGDAFEIFVRQLAFCAAGLPPLVVVALAASALVLVPGLGVRVNGARRWFSLGFVNFQPSELLKLALPVHTSAVLAARWRRLRAGDLRALLLPAVPLVAIAGGLVLFAPDLETALLVAVVGLLPLYIAGLPGRIIAAGGVVGLLVGLAATLSTPYRRARFAAWMDPAAYADTFGYQTVQGFIALGSGGWFGVGLGRGRGKWLYVPNPETDFIFAIIGEELGLIGALTVLALFVALAIGGVRAARRAPDPFGRLLASAITGWLLLQATINIGSVVGLIPVTGVTLPLVSYGGSSLVITMLGLGILLSIARAGRSPEEARAAADASRRDDEDDG
jgi:cell division protein FtsW